MHRWYDRLTVFNFICFFGVGAMLGWLCRSVEVVVPAEHGVLGVLPVAGIVLPVVDMPDGPLPKQRHRPCDKDQLEYVGACWAEVKRQPPCGNYYELRGACYVPVAPPVRPDAGSIAQ